VSWFPGAISSIDIAAYGSGSIRFEGDGRSGLSGIGEPVSSDADAVAAWRYPDACMNVLEPAVRESNVLGLLYQDAEPRGLYRAHIKMMESRSDIATVVWPEVNRRLVQ
jgi:hypothetical protein